jgi:succinate dehydrogenase flavin-adding protein (antitoxin of CptAB toxin-antitoxin module)
MRELDVVLGAYLERYYESAPPDEQRCFRRLLEMPDPELYRLLLGRSAVGDEAALKLVEFLRGITARK